MDKQEPVAWYATDDYGKKFLGWDKHDLLDEGFAWLVPLYIAPPQREWQELTDEEIQKLQHQNWEERWLYKEFARAIEAKLKEKNGE